MKKYLSIVLSFLLLAAAVLSLVSCNTAKPDEKDKEKQTTKEPNDNTVPDVDPSAVYAGDYFDYDLAPFVEVPELSSITVPKSLVDQLLQLNSALALSSLKSFTDVEKDSLTEKYDTVNIDFEGRPKDESIKLEDKVLDGMKSDSYDIMIGSESFIGAYDHPTDDSLDTEGFEDQMIGMKVGETKDILTTFPDNYGEKALAGMQVIFKVTINSAKRPKPIDDETAVKQGYENAKAFNDELFKLTKSQAAIECVLRNAKIVEYPVGDIELLVDYYIQSYIDYYYGTVDDATAEQIRESLADTANTWAKEYAKERMIIKRITDMQGISVTEKELADYAQREAESLGLESGDTLIAYYGKDTIWFEYLYELAVEAADQNVTFES